jgi:hypothetical protein
VSKKPKRKPTPRQRKAAKAYINNFLSGKPVSTAIVLKSVGYGTGLQNQPSRVVESKGFKDSLKEFGLTEELITTALVQDIQTKPEKRVQELKLGAEILGMVKREEAPKSDVKNTYNFLFSPEVQERVKVVNEDIKKMLINPPDVQEN